MLQLTRKADYALRLMLEVGAYADGSIRTTDIARRQQIPYEFLRKVAQTLVSHGLLVSERGLHGGLSLAQPAETITVLDIVRAFDYPALNRCTVDPPRCDRREVCAVYAVWITAQNELERVLEGTRLSRLIGRQAVLDRKGAQDTGSAKGGACGSRESQ